MVEHDKENSVVELEKGQIYFMYRPKVMLTEVENMDDVQKLILVLVPDNSDEKRVIHIPRKTLPEKGEKRLAIVDDVEEDIEELVKKSIKSETYDTFTKGPRRLDCCRPLAEGRYVIGCFQVVTQVVIKV